MFKAAVAEVGSRFDVVFIRKSSQAQDERSQIANAATGLKELGVSIPEEFWFVCTVPRSEVSANTEFKRLKAFIEADRIGTVYIESQDRFGTGNMAELFTLLEFLSDHGTRLYDLRENIDLTEKDDTTEMRVFFGGLKSKKERKDIAYRSLRTRVNNFKDSGSWPNGCQPFGFGKACYSPTGELLWVWHPASSRAKGQVFLPDRDGNLQPGPMDVPIPRKARRDRTVLVLSNHPEIVESVRLIFDLYTRVGLSRRQISARLNAEGRLHYLRQFTHPLVTGILCNPAYVGDTHFGKTQTGKLQTFDASGLMIEVKQPRPKVRRDMAERIVQQNTHEGIVDRKVWERAQDKLTSESQRSSFAPRNPAYYLKQLFVCGHCGKNMTGRTETHPTTKKKTVVYVCSSYIAGRCAGHTSSCGYHRITHADAQKLLLGKVLDLDLDYDRMASHRVRANLEARLSGLDQQDEQFAKQWRKWMQDGVNAFAAYLNENFKLPVDLFRTLRKKAAQLYSEETVDWDAWRQSAIAKGLPSQLRDFRAALEAAEQQAIQQAEGKLAELTKTHSDYTLAWAKASDLQQSVLKDAINKLEQEIEVWQDRTIPTTKRLLQLYDSEAASRAEREALKDDWPRMENREKGEAMRRLFSKVTLYWQPTFHQELAKPDRPRKTARQGRYSYKLQHQRTEWSFAPSNLGGSW